MVGCLLIPGSEASLLPVSTVCKELDLSFTVSQGGDSSFFGKDGLVVQELSESGGLHLLNSDSKTLKRNELDLESALTAAPGEWLVQKLGVEAAEVHFNIMNSEFNSELNTDCVLNSEFYF